MALASALRADSRRFVTASACWRTVPTFPKRSTRPGEIAPRSSPVMPFAASQARSRFDGRESWAKASWTLEKSSSLPPASGWSRLPASRKAAPATRRTGVAADRATRRTKAAAAAPARPDPETKEQSPTAIAAEALRKGVLPITRVRPAIPHEDDAIRVGDPDDDSMQNEYSGEDTPGGSTPTPDQSGVDDIGRAVDAGQGMGKTQSVANLPVADETRVVNEGKVKV